MGNIQSFNNFASTITNTFSLPFINKMLKKNKLQKISMKQYSQLKNKGFEPKDILEFKRFQNQYITKEEYKKLKNNKFGFQEIADFIKIKIISKDIKVDNYIKLKSYFKTYEKIFEFVTLKELDGDLTVSKYNDYLKQFKTFDKAEQYFKLKKLYPELTDKEYKDILDHNLKKDQKNYFWVLKKQFNSEKLTVGYFKELSANLTEKQIMEFLFLKEKDEKDVLTVDEYKKLLDKKYTLEEIRTILFLKSKNVSTDDEIERLIKQFGTDTEKMVDFLLLKKDFRLFTFDEYKKLLDKKYTLVEIRTILFLKTYNVLTDDEIQRLMKEFGTDVQKMVDFVLLKKDFRLFTFDEYKKLLKLWYQPREIRQLLQRRQKQQQKQQQKKQIDKLILLQNQDMIQKLKKKTVQERKKMNREVLDELITLNNNLKPDGSKDKKRIYKLGNLKKNIQSLAQAERRRISRSSETSQPDIDQID